MARKRKPRAEEFAIAGYADLHAQRKQRQEKRRQRRERRIERKEAKS